MLPRVSDDGQLPRQAYARPVPGGLADGQRRIAIVVAGLGLSESASRDAIAALPGAVTLAFSAYSPDAVALQALAREAGHEMLASLPMEPDSAYDSAGERALSTGLTPAENLRHLEWVLGRTQGYAGLTGASDGLRGERFASLSTVIAPVLDQVARRGLYYFDVRSMEPLPGDPLLAVPHVRADVVLDDPPGRADIDAKLLKLERVAQERGSAVAVALQLRPVTRDRIAAWAAGAEARGMVLVPLSALVGTPSK